MRERTTALVLCVHAVLGSTTSPQRQPPNGFRSSAAAIAVVHIAATQTLVSFRHVPGHLLSQALSVFDF